MKKAFEFIKRNYKKIFVAVVVIVAVYIGFGIMHAIATAERGYNAIGGEVFVLLIPYICYVSHKNIKELKRG